MRVWRSVLETGTRVGPLESMLALVVFLGVSAGPLSAQEPARIPDAMRKLERLLGAWQADRVEFLDEEGNLARVSSAEVRNRSHLCGLAVHHVGRLLDPEIEVHGWFYFDPERGALRMASVSSRGRYDEFVGRWDDGRLVLVAEPRADDGDRRFRLIQDEITGESFRERLEVSEDGGESWRVSSRQVFRRVADAGGQASRSDGCP